MAFSLAKRSGSPEGSGDAKRVRLGGGFSQVATQQIAAQVAAAKATTDQILRDMRRQGDGPEKATSSRMSAESQQVMEVKVGRNIVEHLMTPEHRQMLAEESGAEVTWEPKVRKVKLVGAPKALNTAKRFLDRVEMHCHWGASRDKVRRLLRRQQGVESVLVRLSPMTVNALLPAEKTFHGKEGSLSIGKDKQNDVVIQDTAISRQHCVISFDAGKGAVYVADLSTNGTFLNGIRLPSKRLGKVLLSHGDELLLKDPAVGDAEFGYICNLTEISVRAEVRLEAPKRLLSPEEISISKGF